MAEHHGNCATAKRRSGQQEKKKNNQLGKKKREIKLNVVHLLAYYVT
jgi:hypothetical protein